MMKVNRSHSIVNNLKDKFEYIGTFLASFHYIFQIPYVIYLTARVKLPFNKIIDNNLDKFLLILLFISGLISS
ncbi:MAG: hypothetical protein NZ841_01095, partial [Dictyoglomus sp.]|nr:hypothetical protein [Dictyoglomus sp.]MDW8187885.1 hypothetical protein [Dictyoglomus sp.]